MFSLVKVMNRQAKIFFAIVILLCACAPAWADNIDAYIMTQMQKRHVPGVSLAVIRDGRLIKARAYGLANVELNVPVTIDTVFEIGSITKQFTASAIMLLVQEGKVKLDDPISNYLSGTPEAWNPVTVRHLLTHTSGIKTYTGLQGFEFSRRLKADEFIKALSDFPLDFPPGEKYSYSNSGYNLLGLIIEKVSGQSYWQFMAERIFRPVGMSATRDRDPKPIIPKRATGYEWENNRLTNRDANLTDVFSAGATVSNVLDLVKWDHALNTERPLKKSLKDQMWTPLRFNNGKPFPYSFGWNIEVFRGHRIIRHGGQTAGFSATFARYVDDRLTVILLCNLGDIGLANRMGQGIAKIYLPALSLSTLKEKPDPDPQTTRKLRNALSDLTQTGPDTEQITPELRAAFSTARAKDLTAILRGLKSLSFLESENVEKDTTARLSQGISKIYRYKMLTVEGALYLTFYLTEEGKLADIIWEKED